MSQVDSTIYGTLNLNTAIYKVSQQCVNAEIGVFRAIFARPRLGVVLPWFLNLLLSDLNLFYEAKTVLKSSLTLTTTQPRSCAFSVHLGAGRVVKLPVGIIVVDQ